MFILIGQAVSFAIPVIPGAKGFGIDTPAGRGGQIIKVTNLKASGSGSLKSAIDASGPRIIIFEVSGNIEINGRLKVENPYITIAGQTAPSPGITLKNCTFTIDTHDVLIQHLRFRAGDGSGVSPTNRDAINIGLQSPLDQRYNIIIDHCSISWGIDENTSSDQCNDVTWRNCIFSEALNDSLHLKGPHSKTILFAKNTHNISFYDNLLAHAEDRNPYIADGDLTVFVANNLIYNPGDFGGLIRFWESPGFVTLVGNVVIKGANSNSTSANYFPTMWKDIWIGSEIYLEDNKTELGTQQNKDDWSYVRNRVDGYTLQSLEATFKADIPPVWPAGFTPRPSSEVEDYIINNAGARPAERDQVDERIINDLINRSGTIIDSPSDVGGYPDLEENTISHVLPSNPNSDDDADGYTNIEEWLHNLAKAVESTVVSPEDLIIKSLQ